MKRFVCNYTLTIKNYKTKWFNKNWNGKRTWRYKLDDDLWSVRQNNYKDREEWRYCDTDYVTVRPIKGKTKDWEQRGRGRKKSKKGVVYSYFTNETSEPKIVQWVDEIFDYRRVTNIDINTSRKPVLSLSFFSSVTGLLTLLRPNSFRLPLIFKMRYLRVLEIFLFYMSIEKSKTTPSEASFYGRHKGSSLLQGTPLKLFTTKYFKILDHKF